jgi:hypothetical protein
VTVFKKDDIVQIVNPDLFISAFARRVKDRDGVIEWVGPDRHGQFKDRAKVRFLKRNGRGKEFSEIMSTRDLKLKENP